ncbi:type VI secretion system Vgr family protein [Paludibacterium purpuratum]|uniref:Type VI secretion system secreted protein VgrG n=1 Tax=Paludibacterium purpuratum TaxID=1144873 RepID=A0A4R7BG12_9NEIS|nr:type VI secretion system Vgr family protein [Paludibacterium purpuratum]TDR82636.1 type VI secretion system secreted protein VgrG [Paludibacterium purpuratum]
MDITSLLASFATAFNQESRALSLALADSFSAEQLLPLEVVGEEGVSRAYRYRLTCLSPDCAIELKTLLGLPARFGIAGADGVETVRCGVVSKVELLGSDGGFARYALTVESPFSLLRHRKTSRVFQDVSVPDIVKKIFAEHAAANAVFARVQTLDLHVRDARPRRYCLQYRESDFDFVERLLSEEGYAWRFDHSDDASGSSPGTIPQVKLVVFDDSFNLPEAAVCRVRYHRADATEAEDGLTDWQASRQIVPGSVALASFDYQPVSTRHAGDDSRIEQGRSGAALQASLQDYDSPGLHYAGDIEQLARYAQLRQQAHDLQAKAFQGSGPVRGLAAGQIFRLDDHPAHEQDRREQREFVVTQQSFTARNNLPTDLAQIAGMGDRTAQVPFHTQFQAQRRGIRLTPPYADSKHAKPTSLGSQTATVVGPAEQEVYTDRFGRLKVQFHWQRQGESPADLDDKSSCWLRMAMPSAGAGFGHQFLPRVGQEVLVDFIENDIDRPVIIGVLYNGSHPTPGFSGVGRLPANKTLSGIKSKEHQGSQYNEWLFDDTPGEVRAKFSSEHAKTQLNLGFLTHPRQDGKAEARGEGAELRTDASLALRAAQGVLLTTYARLQASQNQLAREETLELLDQCAELFQAFGDYAAQHQALPLDRSVQQALIAQLKAWEHGSNTAPKQSGGGAPLMSLAAQGGLSYSTPAGIVGYAGLNYDLAAKKHLQCSAGEQYSVQAGNGISLFAQSGDMRLIAHQGPMLLQAQHNSLTAEAEQNIRLSVVNGEVLVHAPTIRLVSNAGSFIKLDGNITLGTPGKIFQQANAKHMSGPAGDSVPSPNFAAGPTDQKFQLHYPGGGAVQPDLAANRDYEITLKDGSVLKGTTDDKGQADLLQDQAMQVARARILPKQN